MNPFLRLCATIAVAAAIHAGSFSALPASEGGASHGAEPAAGSHADGNTGEATGAHGSGATGASGGHGDTAEGAADGEQHVSKRELAYDVLPDGSDQPWRLVRNLQVLQDGIVAGEQSKLDEYRYEINRVGRILGNAGSAVWQVQRNLDAAAMLLLFGGDAAVGRHALAATRLGELDTAPLKAALDYRENNFRAASEYFLYYDVSRLPPSMRGQFTFIAGIIFGNSNAETAEKLFDRAALLSTGTLVE